MWKQKLLAIDRNTKESLAQNRDLVWVDGNSKTEPTTHQHKQHRTTREINWTKTAPTKADERHNNQISDNRTRADNKWKPKLFAID